MPVLWNCQGRWPCMCINHPFVAWVDGGLANRWSARGAVLNH